MARLTLKAARVNADLTQGEAAKKLGVAPSTIRNWEKGKSLPSADKIDSVCEVYGLPYNDIIFFNK